MLFIKLAASFCVTAHPDRWLALNIKFRIKSWDVQSLDNSLELVTDQHRLSSSYVCREQTASGWERPVEKDQMQLLRICTWDTKKKPYQIIHKLERLREIEVWIEWNESCKCISCEDSEKQNLFSQMCVLRWPLREKVTAAFTSMCLELTCYCKTHV